MAGIEFDFSELEQLAADLGKAGSNAGPFVRKAVEVTARNVRDDWRDAAKGMAHAPAFPYSITYDLIGFQGFGATVLDAEIGPDKTRTQGALGNLIEFGSRNNPPKGLGHGALQRNEEDFVTGLEKAIDDAMREAGL